MNLQQLKEEINKTDFSLEVKAKMNEILDQAISRGGLSETEKKTLLSLIDLEIKANDIEKEACEEAILALESFNAEIDKAMEMAADEIDQAGQELEEDIDKIGKGDDQV